MSTQTELRNLRRENSVVREQKLNIFLERNVVGNSNGKELSKHLICILLE